MQTITSKDGTKIAYDKAGSGPALVLVDGALCFRKSGVKPAVMPELSKHFTVYAYDRRGRGDSGNTEPYAMEREIEDLQAMMDVAGGSPYVCTFSSGAALAIYGIQKGLAPKKLALFEPPFTVVNPSDPKPPADAVEQLEKMIAEGRRADAVTYFMTSLMGAPGFFMIIMKLFMKQAWENNKAVAPTLPYDISLLAKTNFSVPKDAAKTITMPTVVMGGEKSPLKLRNAVEAMAAAIPRAEVRWLPKQTHMIKPEVFIPALVDFFKK